MERVLQIFIILGLFSFTRVVNGEIEIRRVCNNNLGCHDLPVLYPSQSCNCYMHGFSILLCIDTFMEDTSLEHISFDEVRASNGTSTTNQFYSNSVRYLLTNGHCNKYIKNIEDALFIDSCPVSFSDSEAKELCEDADTSLPPVDYKAEIHIPFRNIYCARCNGLSENVNTLIPWNNEITCSHNYTKSFSEIRSGLMAGDCRHSFIPPTLRSICKIKNEILEIISTQCRACLTLNGTVEGINCIMCGIIPQFLSRGKCGSDTDSGLTVLFELPTETEVRIKLNGGVYRSSEICHNNENYDLLFMKCREFRCAPNEYAKNGLCHKNTTIYISPESQPLPYRTNVVNVDITFLHYAYRIKGDKPINVISQILKEAEEGSFQLKPPVETRIDDESVAAVSFTTASLQITLGKRSLAETLTVFGSLSFDIQETFINYEIYNFIDDILNTSNPCLGGEYQCFNQTPAYFSKEYLFAKIEVYNQSMMFPVDNIFFRLSLGEMLFTELCVCMPDPLDASDLTCPFTLYIYKEVEYNLLENGELHILKTDTRLKAQEFNIQKDSSVLICVDPERLLVSFFKFDAIQTYISWTCSGISLFFLTLTIMFYFVIDPRRNLPSSINVAIALMLIFGQCLLLIPNIGTGTCRYIAALSHFCWLSAFMWMAGQAFNMLVTFHPKTINVADTKCDRKNFWTCILVCFGIPALIVLIFLTMDVISESPLHVRYGVKVCGWMFDQMGIIVSFFVPVGIIMLFNIVCFSITLYYIEKTVAASKNATRRKADRFRCLIYLKMSSVMGFSWIFGFLASAFDISPLWYLYILLNGLQGLFMFLSFYLNARNRQLVVQRFSRSSLFSLIFTIESDVKST